MFLSKRKGIEMIGSGINSIESSQEVICRECRWEGELDGSTHIDQYDWSAECPNCKEIIEVYLWDDPMFADPEDR